MKNVFFKSLIIALCAVSFYACKEKEDGAESTSSYAPSNFNIFVTVTDEDGQPLESIRVCVDTIKSDLKNGLFGFSGSEYSLQDGKYDFGYRYTTINHTKEEWPSEIILIASDSNNIYETQTQTFPVVVAENTATHKTIGGYVEANFVMKKK